mmetsp:Transcript_46433/g.52664  ORF Transcript_46433/g.52664 Transcript_46433/m.52664 type:complete len:220 (+) Transcript_46433:233-892(+)
MYSMSATRRLICVTAEAYSVGLDLISPVEIVALLPINVTDPRMSHSTSSFHLEMWRMLLVDGCDWLGIWESSQQIMIPGPEQFVKLITLSPSTPLANPTLRRSSLRLNVPVVILTRFSLSSSFSSPMRDTLPSFLTIPSILSQIEEKGGFSRDNNSSKFVSSCLQSVNSSRLNASSATAALRFKKADLTKVSAACCATPATFTTAAWTCRSPFSAGSIS